MNGDVEPFPQIVYPPSHQQQLQPSHGWTQECTPCSSQGFSSLSYTSSPMYSDLGGLPTVTSSPYAGSQPGPTFLGASLSRQSNDRRFGQFPSPYNHIPRSRPASPPQEVTKIEEESEHGWPASPGHGHGFDSNRECANLTSVTQTHYGLPSPYAASSPFDQAGSSMLLEMDQNVKREDTYNKISRDSFISQPSSSASEGLSSVSAPLVKASKPRRRTTPETAKQACTMCGKLFTRLSNCTAHMETHNPDRKRPHKCTMFDCRKKFSRKTDLLRHIDSVSPFIQISLHDPH